MRALILAMGGMPTPTGLSGCNRLFAACYAKPVLHIVKVRRQTNGEYQLVQSGCASFLFEYRDPIATGKLKNRVARLLERSSIDRMVLRTGQMRGTYVPHALSFKAEAVLDLELGRSLLRVDSAGVANWVRKQEIAFPDPQGLGFSHTWQNGQLKAIEAAIFAMSGGKVFSGEAELGR